jgi:hypothetical protein
MRRVANTRLTSSCTDRFLTSGNASTFFSDTPPRIAENMSPDEPSFATFTHRSTG